MASDNTQQQQDIRSMKRSMTLDLEAGGARARRMRSQYANSPVLTSPDLNRFVLASPEVEQFIKGNIQATSSSSQATPINVYLYPPKEITDKQVEFAKGFEVALANMQQKGQRDAKAEPTVVSLSSALSSAGATGTTSVLASAVATGATAATTTTTTSSTTASVPVPSAASTLVGATTTRATIPQSTTLTTLTNLTAANLHSLNVQMGTVSSNCDLNGSSDGIGSDTSDSMTLRDDQTSLTGGSLGRINMGDQERMKLERKRLRNRIAASKCRKKKLERISQLEDQVSRLKTDNQEFEKMISLLRSEVSSLRQEASIHRQHGCLIDL